MEAVLKLGWIFGFAFVVGFSGAIMPGPMLAVTISETTKRGVFAGPLLVIGHVILEGVLVGGIALGLATFLKNPVVVAVISFVGGAMMCWMGQSMFRSAKHLSLETEAETPSKMHPVWAGIVVSLSNPYWTIWWATIGMSYVIMALEFGWIGVVVFFGGHILSDFVWYTLVSLGVAGGRRIMSDRTYRGMIGVCGIALLGFGLWFFWTGVTKLG